MTLSARVPRRYHGVFEELQQSHGPLVTIVTALRDAGVPLELKHYCILSEKTKYLGYVRRPDRLKLSEATDATVRKT